jgi:Down syndrome cell adhesion protein 1
MGLTPPLKSTLCTCMTSFLDVLAPAGPPEKVHCVALTSTTIQVSWHPPEPHLRNGIIKGYKVLYAPHPGLVPIPMTPLPKTTRLATVTTVLEQLQKFTNYSIQVLAFTEAGDGKYSNPVACNTHTDGKYLFNDM